MRGWIILVGCAGCVGAGTGADASDPSDSGVGSSDTSVSEPSDTGSGTTTSDSSTTVGSTSDTGSTTSGTDCATADGDYDPVGTWDLLAYRPVEWKGPAGTTYGFPETETLPGDVSLDIHGDGTWLFAVSYDTGTRTYSSDQTWSSEPDAVCCTRERMSTGPAPRRAAS